MDYQKQNVMGHLDDLMLIIKDLQENGKSNGIFILVDKKKLEYMEKRLYEAIDKLR